MKTDKVDGYEALDEKFTNNNWAGLKLNNSSRTLLHGSSSDWDFGIGYTGNNDGPWNLNGSTQENSVELYVYL